MTHEAPRPASAETAQEPPTGGVLLVDDDEMVRSLLAAALRDNGIDVLVADGGELALELARSRRPDLVVSDVNMPGLDGLALVRRLRSDPATRALPVVFLSGRTDPVDVSSGLRLGADDYIRKPVAVEEFVARVEARLRERPSPVADLLTDVRAAGVLPPERFAAELGREAERAGSSRRTGWVAVVDLAERREVRRRHGRSGEDELLRAVEARAVLGVSPLERTGRTEDGRLLVLLPEVPEQEAVAALQRLSTRIAGERLPVGGAWVSVTPVVGVTSFGPGAGAVGPAELLGRAAAAAEHPTTLDLRPTRWRRSMDPRPAVRARRRQERSARPLAVALLRTRQALLVPAQLALTVVLGVVAPYLLYRSTFALGVDVSSVVYVVVVVALVLTAASIWTEGFLALDPVRPPPAPPGPAPRASAVIAAYLPNEAATVLETVQAFLAIDYPDLEVVLAYNTPRPLPVEAALQELEARDHRFTALRVAGSTSKAMNVNAALAHVSGEYVGIFDADHHPAPDTCLRAWRWLAGGYDVVQGHCVIRNGDASWVARTVAVEFESIYAVSHPGRARLHGFGVFGGSNGWWRASVLRSTRMVGSMLTEDIDSSLRLVLAGGRIANDPAMISRELAPTTLGQLWNQRMRWAQGWFQVSLRHVGKGLLSPRLTVRQKVGFLFLLGWREAYVWLSLQIVPLLGFLAWRDGGVWNLQWFISVLVLATLFTASVGPGQVLFAWRLAVPEIRARRRWFLQYLLVTSFAYSEFKNLISRVAQVKEAFGERTWKVTPRSVTVPSSPSTTAVPVPEPVPGGAA